MRKQTYQQFKSYALEQYPDNPIEQENLIKSLEEQHFQQYLQQMMQFQEQRQFNEVNQDEMMSNQMQQLNLNDDKLMQNDSNSNNLNDQFNINQQAYFHNNYVNQDDEEEEESENEGSDIEDAEEDEEHSESEVSYDDNYEGKIETKFRNFKDKNLG